MKVKLDKIDGVLNEISDKYWYALYLVQRKTPKTATDVCVNTLLDFLSRVPSFDDDKLNDFEEV